MFFYHTRDDEIIPVSDLAIHARQLPHATIRQLETGGHQFNNDLSMIATDILSLRNQEN